MPDKSFLGTGLKFPITINSATGKCEMSSREESVKESIYLILTTQKTERLMKPDFGTNINAFPFLDYDEGAITLITSELKNTILEQEPRISAVEINVTPQLELGRLIFNVVYTVAENNQPGNLVFPFYIKDEMGDSFVRESALADSFYEEGAIVKEDEY